MIDPGSLSAIVVDQSDGRADRWYLAKTKPGGENSAVFHLNRQKVVTYLPLQALRSRHGGTWRQRIGAYFPGYVFLRLDVTRDRWRSVNGTTGISKLVAAGGDQMPMPVPPGIIEALQMLTDKNGFLCTQATFSPGDDVRFADGPLASFLGRIDKMKGSERALVLVDLMSRKMPIWTDASKLVPA